MKHIQRMETAVRMSKIVIHNDTVYLCGQVGDNPEGPISVGRQGFTWTGTERISRIASWPSWTPPPEMRKRQPGLPITVSGGIINPLGAKALYLGSSVYRIHGTNNARSIGAERT